MFSGKTLVILIQYYRSTPSIIKNFTNDRHFIRWFWAVYFNVHVVEKKLINNIKTFKII